MALKIIATIFMVIPIVSTGAIQWMQYGFNKVIPRKWTIIVLIFIISWTLAIAFFLGWYFSTH